MVERRFNAHTIHQLAVVKQMYIGHPEGLRDAEVALLLNVTRATALRYRHILGAYRVSYGRYSLMPTADDVLLAHTVLLRFGHNTINPHKR